MATVLVLKEAKCYKRILHRGRRRQGKTGGAFGFALIPIAIGILCTQAPIPLAFLFFKKKKVTMLVLEPHGYVASKTD